MVVKADEPSQTILSVNIRVGAPVLEELV